MIAPNVVSRKKHHADVRRQPKRYITDRGISLLALPHDGLWDWYIPEDQFHVSPYWYTLLGYDPHEIRLQYDTWIRLLHPADRKHIVKQLRDWLRKKDECFEIEFRLRRKSGEWCWILSRGKIIEWDERNKPSHLIGTYHDITERKDMTEPLQTPEKRLRYLSSRQALQHKTPDSAGNGGEYQPGYRVMHDVDQRAAAVGQVLFDHEQTRRGAGIVQYMTERIQAENELRASEARAQALKEQVLSMLMVVSHDLRSPLISVQATLKLLLRGRYGKMDESAKNTVIDLYHRADTLLGVAEECLAGASVVAGDIELEKNVLDLRQEVIDPVLKELFNEIKEQAMTIDNRLSGIPAAKILVNANKVWLKIVYRNLFRNAITYGDRKGLITFGCEDYGSCYKLNVYNSGKPVPETSRDLLFTQFYRVEDRDKTVFEGMGLGLYLARKIIRKHGGDMWYEAKEYGSNFAFTLPRDAC